MRLRGGATITLTPYDSRHRRWVVNEFEQTLLFATTGLIGTASLIVVIVHFLRRRRDDD